jgi:hypothetical protein
MRKAEAPGVRTVREPLMWGREAQGCGLKQAWRWRESTTVPSNDTRSRPMEVEQRHGNGIPGGQRSIVSLNSYTSQNIGRLLPRHATRYRLASVLHTQYPSCDSDSSRACRGNHSRRRISHSHLTIHTQGNPWPRLHCRPASLPSPNLAHPSQDRLPPPRQTS